MTRGRVLGFLGILGLLFLYGYRLDFPNKVYYDEVYHVKTAREFLTLSGNTDTAHPPVGKLLMAGSIKLFGDKSWVWRLSSYLCGTASIILFFFLSRRLFRSSGAAWAAAFLLALDGISFTQSRIAMLNTPMFLFMLLSLWFFLKYVEKRTLLSLLLTGVFLGLTASTRWVGLGVLAVMGMLLVPRWKKIPDKGRLFGGFAVMILITLVIYVAGHIVLTLLKNYGWKGLWKYQTTMLTYHWNLKEGHVYGSAWWSWPLLIRPIWYFRERAGDLAYDIMCIGNPAIFWVFIPAAFYMALRAMDNKDRVSLFILLGFLSQWLPWAFISRVKFFHYFYSATPFTALGLAWCLNLMWKSGRTGRYAAGVYLGLVALMFIYWYPLLSGYPVPQVWAEGHFWFKSWI